MTGNALAHPAPLLPSLLAILLVAGHAAAADTPAFLGDPKCRIAVLEPKPMNDFVEWSGACKEGFAEGQGKLSWRSWEKGKHVIEGKLVRGQISGEGKLTYKPGVYTGTFRNGVPHGQGYFEYADERGWYEGEVVNGRREGFGIQLDIDRARYDGHWKEDAQHGTGRATFAFGGSYDGEWKNGKFDGKGVIVYAGSGHKYEGQFADGRVAGSAVPTVKSGHFALLSDLTSNSRIRQELAVSTAPMDASWANLSTEQKNFLKSAYLALEEGDEPPHPLNGSRELIAGVVKINQKLGAIEGTLRLHVLVGADGSAKLVKAIVSPHPEVTKYFSTLAGLQRYKPAICRGQPCEMIYPIQFKFKAE